VQQQSSGPYDFSMGRKPKSRRDPYGAWLHHLRTEKGLSQDALCQMIGVPQSTWAHWERTGRFAGREIIVKTAEVLGVSVSELLRVK
jgi:transcriptional regulator with XRE-family HTH domain